MPVVWETEPGMAIFLRELEQFDLKQGIRRNFARRAGSYDRYAMVQRLMAEELLSRARAALGQADRILELGCGTGYLTEKLRRARPGAALCAVDLDARLVAHARQRLGPDSRVDWLVADAETMEAGSFDLIISNATFQWLTRPGDTLRSLSRGLLPGGRLAFATLGPGTFLELAAAMRQAAETMDTPAPPIAAQAFLPLEQWRELLGAAGFSRVQLERRLLEVPFPTVGHFLKALQATGATNPRPRPFSPRLLRQLTACYDARFRRNGTIPVTYEIIWVTAGKGQ